MIEPNAFFRTAVALHQQGRLHEAEARLCELLDLEPQHAQGWHLRGLIALGSGEARLGIEWIEHSLRIEPSQPAAHANIGNYHLAQNQPETALLHLDRAIQLKPDYPVALYNRGNALRSLGRREAAVANYDRVLELQADHWPAMNNRGLALLEMGRSRRAAADFERALQLCTDNADVWRNLGAAHLSLDQPERAVPCYEHACRSQKDDADAWCGLGNAWLALRRPDEALRSYNHALFLQPDNLASLINRARVLLQLRRPADAELDARAALRQDANSQVAQNNLGNALLALGRDEDALACYDQALHFAPEAADSLYNRSIALRKLMRYVEAAECAARLLRLPGGDARRLALGHLFQLRMDGCNWSGYAEIGAQLRAAVAAGEALVNPMTMLLFDEPALQRRAATAFAADLAPPAPAREPTAPGSRRVCIAFVSADLREHPVSYLLVGVLERIDRERFEVLGVSLSPPEDSAFARRVQSAFDRFMAVDARNDAEVAEWMRDLKVDIAVDLMGFTDGQRSAIFAHHCAPVQMSFLGYAGTLGAPYMHYLLADSTALPPGGEDDFAENVVRLPFCYLPNDSTREIAPHPTRTACGLPEAGAILCAFGNPCKINPPLFGVWMRILRAVPGSVLWLRVGAAEGRMNLQREAQLQGVDARRLIFAPRVDSMALHLARLSCADLFLDTHPYNAHSTACDALWAGVPIVTCAGKAFASRVAASALAAVDLADLITSNLADYEERILQLLLRPQELHKVRARLEACRLDQPLFDTARFTRHLESALWAMHVRSQRGEEPAPFNIGSDGGAYGAEGMPWNVGPPSSI